MYRRKKFWLLFTAFGTVILIIVASLILNFQLTFKNDFLSMKNGEDAIAKTYKLPAEVHMEGEKNKLRFVFEVDGKSYAGISYLKYDFAETKQLSIRYAVENGEVRLRAKEDVTTINGKEYRLAYCYEIAYLDFHPTPSLSMAIAVFVIAAAVMGCFAYFLTGYIALKRLERTGILTYAVFIEATAPRAGSNRNMSIRYKYKDTDENWVEANTPHTFNTLDVDKLMSLETFKIRYKGNKSMIVENTKRIKLE